MEYVYSPLYPVVHRGLLPTSHRSGWGLYWAEGRGAQLVTSEDDLTLADRLRPGDRVLLYHGMEFQTFLDGRSLNVYRGREESMAQRFELLHRLARELGPRLISLDLPMPPYGKLIAGRASYPSFAPYRHAWSNVDFTRLDHDLTQGGKMILMSGRQGTFVNELVLGDSHALSLMRPGARVARHDGLTLHGALQRTLVNLVGSAWTRHDLALNRLVLYLGNIDLRHHLARPDATSSTELVDELRRQLRQVAEMKGLNDITVVQPLPIEHEGRKVPRTGWYKGTPFYGSWEQRNELRAKLNRQLARMCSVNGFSYYRHPAVFTNAVGQLDEAVMERPGSVHVQPAFYRHRLEGHPWTCF